MKCICVSILGWVWSRFRENPIVKSYACKRVWTFKNFLAWGDRRKSFDWLPWTIKLFLRKKIYNQRWFDRAFHDRDQNHLKQIWDNNLFGSNANVASDASLSTSVLIERFCFSWFFPPLYPCWFAAHWVGWLKCLKNLWRYGTGKGESIEMEEQTFCL